MLLRQELVQYLLLTTSFAASQTSALEYDHLIIGGGTSGLTVANRLSELPNISVAVIEAGGEVDNNPNVTSVDKFSVAIGTSIDWQYLSTNQTYAAGQRIQYASGKALGGSSAINGEGFVLIES
jgi:choline dehydrogenase-like flavoprotein